MRDRTALINRFTKTLAIARYLLHDQGEERGWEGHREDIVAEDLIVNQSEETKQQKDDKS